MFAELPQRRAKIVCTIGPASADEGTLDALMAAGMDVARLNMSHGDQQEKATLIARLRALAARCRQPVAILLDLQGRKIRTGALVGGRPVRLRDRTTFTLTTRPVPGDASVVSTDFAALPRAVRPRDTIFLADGTIHLEVQRVQDDDVHCRVVEGGVLRERQGINLPGAEVSGPALTDQDRADIRFGVGQGVDYFAASFVRGPEDVMAAREAIASAGRDTPVIAKLEKRQALERLEEILEVSDGVMVARGDMGVELPLEEVPVWQKHIIRAANRRLVPAITATQMLESMVESPRPTRAEASDVANAVWDGSDALMLSAETAVGRDPVRVVKTMDRIIRTAERDREESRLPPTDPLRRDHAYAISRAARELAEAANARLIVALTTSGYTARLISGARPPVPVLAFTPDEAVFRQMALLSGVQPLLYERMDSEESLVSLVERIIEERYPSEEGSTVVMVGSLPSRPGGTNFLRLHRVGRGRR